VAPVAIASIDDKGFGRRIQRLTLPPRMLLLVAAALASLQLLDPARPGPASQQGSSRPGTDV